VERGGQRRRFWVSWALDESCGVSCQLQDVPKKIIEVGSSRSICHAQRFALADNSLPDTFIMVAAHAVV